MMTKAATVAVTLGFVSVWASLLVRYFDWRRRFMADSRAEPGPDEAVPTAA